MRDTRSPLARAIDKACGFDPNAPRPPRKPRDRDGIIVKLKDGRRRTSCYQCGESLISKEPIELAQSIKDLWHLGWTPNAARKWVCDTCSPKP